MACFWPLVVLKGCIRAKYQGDEMIAILGHYFALVRLYLVGGKLG